MKIGRVVLAFAFFFGVIILPVAVILPLGFLTAQPPYIIVEGKEPAFDSGRFADPAYVLGQPGVDPEDVSPEFPEARAAVRGALDKKRVLTVAVYPDRGEAKDGRSRLIDRLNYSMIQKTMGKTLYERKSDKKRGEIFIINQYLFHVEGPMKGEMEMPFADMVFLTKNPNKGIVQAWVEDSLGWFLGSIFFYIFIQIFIWPRVGSWAARVDAAGGKPIDANALKNRLMAINDLDLPFEIKPGKRENDLVAEWKYADAKWISIMSAGGVRGLARIKMRLDPKKNRVRSQDNLSKVQWNAGAGGNRTASVSWTAFKGIHLTQFHTDITAGLVFKRGKFTVDKAYEYHFDQPEIKNPLVQAVTASGWDWMPVITFWRIFN